ncbi:HBL225Cp [Eremothecium sinecaudum]|uniref:Dolichyl-phosphate-mannose--protein mannosyltransferase n=1 Tax=Eremothecium sinecaudum TaxID=45286 RepID=A0A120K0U0_9SACH|nr:HBL225Cp [Eremothecium sinecaudum]AMD18677.1 HBL225Cp [Eremothecium sinecaudum]
MSTVTSSFLPKDSDLNLRQRKRNFSVPKEELIKSHNSEFHELKRPERVYLSWGFCKDVLIPSLFTILSIYLRFQKIDLHRKVIWDEAHFGRFGSYYIKHQFYHDLHPPLGKMLVGFGEWLSGFDGSFPFNSGEYYPDKVNFKFMRQFCASFGVLCVPVAYFTAQTMGLSMPVVLLLTLMFTLEHSYIILSKFILLDSILLFFTATSFLCMVKLYSLRRRQFSRRWFLWLLLTGISLGCVCSVKWVGLFVTLLVGVYTIIELFEHYYDRSLGRIKYYSHWIVRIALLIIVPFAIYVICFKIHFSLLYKSGPGDESANSLLQANLEGTKITKSPRDVEIGSVITIRSQGLTPVLLHSHGHKYPSGSQAMQVTGYGFMDANNNWTVQAADSKYDSLSNGGHLKVSDGMQIKLFHNATNSTLSCEGLPSHVFLHGYEVYGSNTTAANSENESWIVEMVDYLPSSDPKYPLEDPSVLHPIASRFRLRHAKLGCYLASSGLLYPDWGFHQGEIVCKQPWATRDKSSWWNVEDHRNVNLTIDEKYKPPKPNFFTNFIIINFAMAVSNSALLPDPEKFDSLTSKAWQWPILHIGMRMGAWENTYNRYFLMGSPYNTWLSTASLLVFILFGISTIIRWQRQSVAFRKDNAWEITIKGLLPFLGWFFNYFPFVMMERVTYVHHYAPALYFAVFVFGFIVDHFLSSSKSYIKYPIYMALYGGCIYTYLLFAPIAQGMTGDNSEYKHLEWLNSWNIS